MILTVFFIFYKYVNLIKRIMKRRDTIDCDESNPNVSKSLSQKTKQWCLR